MKFAELGATGIAVSRVAFGAGPVSQTLVGDDLAAVRATVAAALELRVNWFDTAATYGQGRSEENLGRVLAELAPREPVHMATKVRIMPEELGELRAAAHRSVEGSLRRLKCERLTLLQVHNSITALAGAQPTSLSPAHLLSSGGLLEELQRLQQAGLVQHLGLTGLGEPAALAEVIGTGAFATIQIPYNLLNPSAGFVAPADFAQTNYGNLISLCGRRGMGVFAIRVLAGGALAGQPPSPHTLKTPFFPLALYEDDCRRAEQMAHELPPGMSREEAAIRFALSHPDVTCAIIGFGSPAQVGEMLRFADAGALVAELAARLNKNALRTT